MIEMAANRGDGDAITESPWIVAGCQRTGLEILRDHRKGPAEGKTEAGSGDDLRDTGTSRDVKLGSLTRAFNGPIPLIKTEDRLSRNLGDRDFTEPINHQICHPGSRNVLDDMVSGGHTEEVCGKDGVPVQDPRRERTREREGYWLAKAVAAGKEHKKVIPLHPEAYSQEAQDFRGDNDQLSKVIDRVSASIGNKGIYAIDRGGDRGKLYGRFLEKGKEKRFVLRLTRKRDLIHKGLKKNCRLLATALPCLHDTIIIKYENGKEEKAVVSCNALPVKLPAHG